MLTEDLPREADDVERELATLAAHLDADTHRMLALVRGFVALGAWGAPGARAAGDGERALAAISAHLDAATHRMLALVRRFDELGAWGATGARSCAHWLS